MNVNTKNNVFLLLVLINTFYSCASDKNEELPRIGKYEIIKGDTIYHKVPSFKLLDQDNNYVSTESLSNNIYIADFFYSYCPTICPRVQSQMIRIHDKFEKEEKLNLLSFALDPKRDNVENLRDYSNNLGINNSKWHFLTGNKDQIWDLAEEFLITVRDDPDEPGGIFHSGKILLVDSQGHIRGFANGTEEKDVNRLMNDIKTLLRD